MVDGSDELARRHSQRRCKARIESFQAIHQASGKTNLQANSSKKAI